MKRTKLGISVSEQERAAIQRLAEVEGGLSHAALVRKLVRDEAHRRGLWPPEERPFGHYVAAQERR